MIEDQERQRRARVRERLAALEAQDSAQRAQARERVHAAQERERQERQHRAAASRQRAGHRAEAARMPSEDAGATAPISGGDRRPAVPERGTEPVATMTKESVMSVYEVQELFNHPLGDGEMRQALRILADDPAWSREADQEQDQADQLTFVLVHQPSGARVDVAQERSLVGIWNSRI